LAIGARSFRHVDGILKNGLDRLPPVEEPAAASPTDTTVAPHDSVRGRTY
jgi:hypothetical protein